jgi:ATP-dependent Zn protease
MLVEGKQSWNTMERELVPSAPAVDFEHIARGAPGLSNLILSVNEAAIRAAVKN